MRSGLVKQAYEEAFNRGLVKAALNPRFFHSPLVNPAVRKDMVDLGRRIYQGARFSKDPMAGFGAVLGTGFRQMADMDAIRKSHLDNIGNLTKWLNKVPPGSSAHTALLGQIAAAQNNLRTAQNRLFEEMGTTAAPRISLATRAPMILGAGAALGGLGYLGGKMLGADNATDQMKQKLDSAPWTERLKYLFSPQTPTPNTQ